jgi:hypothetical protein
MLLTWVLTVFSDTYSSVASSRLERPWARRDSTWRSLAVSSSTPGGGPARATSAMTEPTTDGSSRTPPWWTRRMAPSSSAGGTSFRR